MWAGSCCLNRTVQFFLMLLLGVVSASSQDTLRIGTYNLLNYPGLDAAARNPFFRAVTKTMDPDVLVVQEMQSQTGVNGFLANVLNAAQPGTYTSVSFNNGPDTDNSFFYKASKVNFLGATYIGTALRNIAEYRIIPAGHTDTVRIYSLHLKANEQDSLDRLAEATILRNRLNSLPPGSRFIVAGDFNIYRSSEPAFQKLIGSELNNIGRCKDPLNSVGNWHANFSFRQIHSQSTRTRAFGDGSTGGLDDRFDMILTSYSMDSLFVPGSYRTYGNDANHFNDSINRLPNSAVPDSVANGLHYSSDHLPVFASFRFGSSGGGTGFTSVASGNWNTAGIWSGGIVPGPLDNAVIATGTTVTIDGTVSCNTVTVFGILQFDATDGRSLTSQSNLSIEIGGEMRASLGFSSGFTTQMMNLGGSFINNGTFTPRVIGSSSGTRVVNVTFTGSTAASISGSTSPTNFNQLTVNKSATGVSVSPVTGVAFVANVANALTLTRGTWIQDVSQTGTPNVNITIDANAVLALGGTGSFSTGNASLLVGGMLDVAGGTLNVGGGNNRLEVLAGGVASFSGGATSIFGRLTLTSGTTTIDGGALAVNPRGSTNLGATSNVFEAAGAASIEVSAGSLTIVNPKAVTSSGREIKITSGSGTKSFIGGTFFFGDGASAIAGSDSGFVVESTVPLSNIVLRTGGTAGRDVSLASSVTTQSLTLESGALRLTTYSPGFDLMIGGNLSRINGSLSVGQRTVTLIAASPSGPTSINGDFMGATALYHLTTNNPAGLALGSMVEVNGNLIIGAGVVDTDTNAIVLGSNATLIESAGNPVVGRIATTRSVAQGLNNTFGGIGIAITALDTGPGMTSVLRQTGVASLFGGQSILRSFDLSPTTNSGLNATLMFSYDNTELNGNSPPLLRLWKSADGGTDWEMFDGAVDTSARTVTVSGLSDLSLWTAADTLHFVQGAVTRSYTVNAGWNMISLPLRVANNTRATVFPTSTSEAFAFTGGQGYVQRDSLLDGVGYWLKFGSQQGVAITGFERFVDSVSVVAGWNMIGVPSSPVPVGLVSQIPPGIVASSYFGYNGAYLVADTLQPAKGYWVKVSQDGLLVLDATEQR